MGQGLRGNPGAEFGVVVKSAAAAAWKTASIGQGDQHIPIRVEPAASMA